VRDDWWTMVRFLHVLGAACWVGGMVVLGLVAVPAARRAGGPGARRDVVTAAARRFGVVGGVALAVLVATGFGLIDHRGIALADLPDSDYGRRLLAKMGLVVVMGVLALVHALWQGPRVRLSEEAGDAAAAARWRRLGAAIDGALLLAALATLWLAVSLIP
jgi:putative copper resistance protein D